MAQPEIGVPRAVARIHGKDQLGSPSWVVSEIQPAISTMTHQKRPSDDFFENESKLARQTLNDLKSTEFNAGGWRVLFQAWTMEKSVDWDAVLSEKKEIVQADRKFGFLCDGGRSVVQSLDLIAVGLQFVLAFLDHFRWFPTEQSGRPYVGKTIDRINADYKSGMETLGTHTHWSVLVLWKSNRLTNNKVQHLDLLRETLAFVDLTVLNFAPAYSPQLVPDSTEGMLGWAQTILAESATKSSIGLANRVSNDRTMSGDGLKAIIEAGEETFAATAFNPFTHVQTVLKEELEICKNKIKNFRVTVPVLLDEEFINYLREIGFDEPATVVARFKELNIYGKLDFEMMDIEKMDPERPNATGPASAFAKRDYIRLRHAHANLGLNPTTLAVKAMIKAQKEAVATTTQQD